MTDMLCNPVMSCIWRSLTTSNILREECPFAFSSNRQQALATHCNIFPQTVTQVWSDDKSHREEVALMWQMKNQHNFKEVISSYALYILSVPALVFFYCWIKIKKKKVRVIRLKDYCCLLSLQYHFQQNWSLIQMLIELKFVSMWDMASSLHEFVSLSLLILFILPFPRD